MLSTTTNTENFMEFLEVLDKENDLKGVVLVLDNHKSHYS